MLYRLEDELKSAQLCPKSTTKVPVFEVEHKVPKSNCESRVFISKREHRMNYSEDERQSPQRRK